MSPSPAHITAIEQFARLFFPDDTEAQARHVAAQSDGFDSFSEPPPTLRPARQRPQSRD